MQASLRRAVSAAYYALFHYLIDQACNQVVNHAPGRTELRRKLGRAFQHAQMKSAAKAFSSGAQQKQNKWFDVAQIPQALSDVAEAFAELQEARHTADYDLNEPFYRSDAIAHVTIAENAVASFHQIRGTHAGRAFLLAMLVKTRSD